MSASGNLPLTPYGGRQPVGIGFSDFPPAHCAHSA